MSSDANNSHPMEDNHVSASPVAAASTKRGSESGSDEIEERRTKSRRQYGIMEPASYDPTGTPRSFLIPEHWICKDTGKNVSPFRVSHVTSFHHKSYGRCCFATETYAVAYIKKELDR